MKLKPIRKIFLPAAISSLVLACTFSQNARIKNAEDYSKKEGMF